MVDIEELKCCNKEMTLSKHYSNGVETERVLCLECGYYETLIKGYLDEEELIKEVRKNDSVRI